MDNWVTDMISGWIKQGLVDAVMERVRTMFDSINTQIGEVASNIGRDPQSWNSTVFNMVRSLSDTVILPVAGMILTFVLCYELITMIIERNNMHEFDIANIYKWIIKTLCAVYILTNTFNIVMGVFGLAQEVVNNSAGVIGGNLNAGVDLTDFEAQLNAMGIWELIGLWLETFVVDFCMQAMSVVIFVITFGRMIEVYLTVSIAPIPLATIANREWGQIGSNYLKSLFALAFQAFLIMVCVAIYAALVGAIPNSGNVYGSIWETAGYTILLCFGLFQTSNLSKRLFGAG